MSDDAPIQFQDRRNNNGISVKLDLLHEDVQDMKSVLKELTAAISRLAVVESNQGHISAAQERGFTALAKLEARQAAYEKSNDERLKTLETQAVTTKQTNDWVGKAMWAAAAAAATFIAKKVGLI